MANFQFTGNRSSFSRGLCCCGELLGVLVLVLVVLASSCTRACSGDGVGGQQGITHQAVLQALVLQDLQLRPDISKA